MRALVVGVALVLVASACVDRSDNASLVDQEPSATTTSEAPSTTDREATATTLSQAASLVFDACAATYEASQVGIDLAAAMVHESIDDETARIAASMDHGAELAAEAAGLDSRYAEFAVAFAYWRDNAIYEPGDSLEDPQMDEALHIHSATCTGVGVPNGERLIDLREDEIFVDTPERGRFDACDDLIFGDDGAVYVEGERFTFQHCEELTQPALNAADRNSAYSDAVSLFFAATGGYVCWGEVCRDESDF